GWLRITVSTVVVVLHRTLQTALYVPVISCKVEHPVRLRVEPVVRRHNVHELRPRPLNTREKFRVKRKLQDGRGLRLLRQLAIVNFVRPIAGSSPKSVIAVGALRVLGVAA